MKNRKKILVFSAIFIFLLTNIKIASAQCNGGKGMCKVWNTSMGGSACDDDENYLNQDSCPSGEVCCSPKNGSSYNMPSAQSTSGAAAPTTGGAYQNQEKIPGFGQTDKFPEYLKQIINFGFAAIGIFAMFMLMIGAYQYLMAAGNIAKEESAKTTISSAFSGLILGLVAFLLLRTINPDLVSFNLSNLTGGPTGQSITSPTGTSGGSKGTGSGKCEPVQSGPCSEAYLGGTCMGANSYQASSICNAESGGGAGVVSRTDITADGRSFSVGLFQINLTVHSVGGLNCKGAFSGTNKSATVINESLYQQCVQAAQDPDTNIKTACAVGNNGTNWRPWGANSKCGF